MLTNWLGKLRLVFSIRSGRSLLVDCCHSGPFLIQKCFYPDNDFFTPHVYLLHPSGGIVSGDKLILDVYLNTGSKALLTTPSATKFYRSNGIFAFIKQRFRLENNSILEWFPQCNIFFPSTKVKSDITFFLEKGSKFIFFDMLCFGHPTIFKNFDVGELDFLFQIYFLDSIKLQERLRINRLDFKIKLGGSKIFASLFAVPANEIILSQVRRLIKRHTGINAGGATLLDNILVVRLLGNDNRFIKNLLHCIWYTIRPNIIGRQAVAPRVWLT